MDYLELSETPVMKKIELMGKDIIVNKLNGHNIIHIFRTNDRHNQLLIARSLNRNITNFEELADFLGIRAIDKITLRILRKYPSAFDSAYYRKFIKSMLRILIRNDKDFVPNEELLYANIFVKDEDIDQNKYLFNSHGNVMASEEEIEQIKREVAS